MCHYSINAIDKSTDLKDWYCERALQSYKNRLSIAVSEHEKEVIDKKAYGAMKADLADKERNIKYLDLISRKMSMKTDMMRGIEKGFSLLTLFCSLIPLLFDILFYICLQ